MIKKILSALLFLCILWLLFYNITIRNIFITPILHIVRNIEQGNIPGDKHLKKYSINFEVKKYFWDYDIRENNDSLRIHFTGPSLNKGADIFLYVDAVVYNEKINSSAVNVVYKTIYNQCNRVNYVIKNKYMNSNENIKYFFCKENGSMFGYFYESNKNIFITVYPYNKQYEKIALNLIVNIVNSLE